jgi:NADPH-dependent curcumin reductase CurA
MQWAGSVVRSDQGTCVIPPTRSQRRTDRHRLRDRPRLRGHPPVFPGDLVPGHAVARIEDPFGTEFKAGGLVLAATGWQEWAMVPANQMSRLPPIRELSPTHALGALGMPGLTAYAGVTRLLRPRIGDTVQR